MAVSNKKKASTQNTIRNFKDEKLSENDQMKIARQLARARPSDVKSVWILTAALRQILCEGREKKTATPPAKPRARKARSR